MPLPERITLDIADLPAAEVQVRVNRRARKIRLRLDHDGQAVLVLPSARAFREGRAFLRDHTDWLADRLRALPPRVPFAADAVIPYLGRDHRIHHLPDGRGGVWRELGEIMVAGQEEHLPRRLTDWLKAEARRELAARARGYADELDRDVKRVGVRDTKGRWGSCSAKGNLSFCWRLILAPEAVLDYVAAHEVAHLMEHNHSPRFWAIVERLRPDYRESEAWLRRHGASLHRYG